MKKLLSIVLTLTVCVSLCSLGAAAEDGMQSFYENFSAAEFSSVQKSGYFPNPKDNSAIADSEDTLYGNVLRMTGIKTNDNGGSYSVGANAELAVSFEEPYDTASKNVLVSYDIKPYQTTQAVSVMFNNWINNGGSSANTAYSFYLTQDGYISAASTGAEYNGGIVTGQFQANEWMHIDMLVSRAENKIDYYIDGAYIASTNLSTEKLKDGKIYSLVFVLPTAEGQSTCLGTETVDIDNVSVSYVTGGSFGAAAKAGDGYVDVVFDEPIENIADVSAAISKAETNTTVEISECYKVSPKILRVVYSGTLDRGDEYRVTISGDPVSVLGNSLANKTAYFSTDSDEEGNILFSMNGADIDVLPNVYLNTDKADDADSASYVSWVDAGGENGRCLQIKGDAERTVNAAYVLDSESTGSIIKVTYDINAQQQKQAFSQILNPWYAGSAEGDNIYATNYITMLNHDTGFATSADGLSPWQTNGGAGSKWAPSYTANTWFNVEVIYNFADRTFTTKITNTSTGIVTNVFTNQPLNAEVLKGNSIKSIDFRVINGNLPNVSVSAGANPGDSKFYVDNIVIEDVTPSIKVKNVRFVDYKGEILMPDTEIVPEISAVKINLDGNAEGVDFTNSVSLMCEAEPVLFDGVYENGAYTMMLTNGALKANSDYTLRVDNGNEAYAYSFRTKAGRVIISAFELQKEGAKAQLADLKVNDRVYVKLHIINTSGSAQKMTASISSYQGFLMNGFDYSDITLDADELSYDSESLSLTVTNTENLDIKGFLWSDFETLRPLTDTAELVK